MTNIICLSIITVIGLFLIFAGVYFLTGFGKLFYHDVMKWHMPVWEKTSDGLNTCSKCKYCGKDIMQDSQGNWF